MEKIELIKSKYTYLINIDYINIVEHETQNKYRVVSIIETKNDIVYCQCVKLEDFDAFIEEQKTNIIIETENAKQKDKEILKEACETVLKIDPFGGKFNGKKLIEIYKSNILWVDKAIKEMRNKFIVDKLLLIQKGVNDGKIDI